MDIYHPGIRLQGDSQISLESREKSGGLFGIWLECVGGQWEKIAGGFAFTAEFRALIEI